MKLREKIRTEKEAFNNNVATRNTKITTRTKASENHYHSVKENNHSVNEKGPKYWKLKGNIKYLKIISLQNSDRLLNRKRAVHILSIVIIFLAT